MVRLSKETRPRIALSTASGCSCISLCVKCSYSPLAADAASYGTEEGSLQIVSPPMLRYAAPDGVTDTISPPAR